MATGRVQAAATRHDSWTRRGNTCELSCTLRLHDAAGYAAQSRACSRTGNVTQNQFDGSVALQGLLQISGRDRSGMLNVNNRLVPETTMLSDGDLVIMSDELLSI